MIRQRILTLILAAVFLVAAFGTISMGGDSHVSPGCGVAVTSHASHSVPNWCPMNVSDHLAWWGSTFRGTVNGNSLLAVLTLLASLLVTAIILFSPRLILRPVLFASRGQDPPNLHNFYALFLAAGKARPRL